MLRTFRVRISNVEIINETKEVMDPFIRFIFGGSFFTELKKRGKDNTIHIHQGELGIIHMTDVANFLEGGQAQLFERVIETNYTATYFQLETERLHVEVWDAEGFYMNKWMAYNSIPLIDIIDGPMQHTIELFPYNDKLQPDKLHSTVNLKINFAEVWDFNLEFFDWKTTSLIDADEPEKSITS